jgi:hypothetical protein
VYVSIGFGHDAAIVSCSRRSARGGESTYDSRAKEHPMSKIRRLSQVLAARREHAARRRAHDDALAIPRVATEHATRVELARQRGEVGCDFCH